MRQRLEESLRSVRYAAAIEFLIKNMLIEPAALYRVPAWAQPFDLSHVLYLSHLQDSPKYALYP